MEQEWSEGNVCRQLSNNQLDLIDQPLRLGVRRSGSKIFLGPSRTFFSDLEKLFENHSDWAWEEAWEVWRAPVSAVFFSCGTPSISMMAFSSGAYFPQERGGGHQRDAHDMDCPLDRVFPLHDRHAARRRSQLFLRCSSSQGCVTPLTFWKFTPLGPKGGVAGFPYRAK